MRSKNAGPFIITLDLIFKSRTTYEVVKKNNLITKELIAEKYRRPVNEVFLEYFDEVGAIKASIKRSVASGCPGDSDCYGMQMEAPLLYVNFAKKIFEHEISEIKYSKT